MGNAGAAGASIIADVTLRSISPDHEKVLGFRVQGLGFRVFRGLGL